ncbi:FtsX-like permease family protein [Halalkalicoccus subterraneus]|uniref:FtsX-like permease family protein n=1 Tax=Halalkalicoccus subterraneus TaxID=2675002 RepID=UPI000EFC2B21|nr:FtsX-like permease family protein [Halalkalicoccus subterraneus]
MGYRRSLVRQWSRRDWLTIVIIAVSAAFLVGMTLLLLTAGTQIGALTADTSTATTATYHDSVADAERASGADAIVFPLATVEDGDGTEHTVVGVPPGAPEILADASTGAQTATIPPPGDAETVSGPGSDNETIQFVGQDGELAATVTPHQEETIFPAQWYTTSSSTVERLGATGAIAIGPGDAPSDGSAILPSFDQSDTGVPLVSAHAFLLTGMQEILQMLTVATAAGAIVILVVLYSVTRISVWERLELLAVIRSTGGTPLGVLSLFGLRSTLLSLVGVLGGFFIGTIVPPAVIALATRAGLSVTLEPRLTWPILRVLVPMLAVLVVVGAVAGVLAARPAVTASPTALRGLAGQRHPLPIVHRFTKRLPSSFSPTFLDTRTIVPTGATLAVFVLLVLLVGGLSTAVAPLDTTETGTITSAGASHPIDSRLDTNIADTFRAEGVNASSELVIAQVHDGQSYLVRGADYSDFASVTDTELVAGREPSAPDEAVIGSSLAEMQDVSVGETRTLGGSDRPGVARVTIVGVYESDGTADDQLMVPLETGHQLSLDPGTVHMIRTSGDADGVFDAAAGADSEANADGSTERELVQDVSAPETIVTGEAVPITVFVRNDDSSSVTQTLEIDVGEETIEREITLEPEEETQLELEYTFDSAGTQTIDVHGQTQDVTVLTPETPVLPETLPEEAPPDSTLLVPVTTPAGDPISDATVSIDGTEATTDADGIARIDLPAAEGEYDLTTTYAGEEGTSHTVRIVDGQQRLFGADLEVAPQTGTPTTTPELTVTLANHWPDERTQTTTIDTPVDGQTQDVTLAPGESTTMNRTLGEADTEQIPPGEYVFEVNAEDEPIATETYRVLDGAFDLESLPAEAQYQSGAAMGQLIEQTIGNIQILFGTMIALAGLMTIGSTTAAFAQAVHARKKAISIHRSTGASPLQVLRIIVLDACKLAIPAVVLAAIGAVVALFCLNALGLLSVFGVRLTADLPPVLILSTLAGAVVIAVCSAALAALPTLLSSPIAVWQGTRTKTPTPSNDTGRSDER